MLIPGLFLLKMLTKEFFAQTTTTVTMAVVVLGDLVGATDLIVEHAAVTMIIAVTILAINATRVTIITTLEDLVVILAEVASEVVITITEVTVTEIVTAEVVDTQIAIHVLAHIRALVEDLVTNAAIALVDGGEMALVTALILENHQILEKQSPLQIMVVLLILVMPKFLFFFEE